MTTFTEEVRETVSPHKFGGDRMAAALWLLMLDNGEDESTGNATEWHFSADRFGRRILFCDSFGFVSQSTFTTEAEAVERFEEIA